MRPQKRGLVLALAGIAGLLCACKEEKRVEQYTVPKENAGAGANDFTTGNTAAPAAPSGTTMANTAVPVAPTSAGTTPSWTAPEGWLLQPESPMRKAAWKTSSGANAADVTVTAFPGDVGGLQANVGRWCGQVGLPAPATPEALAALCASTTVSGLPATRVTLRNGDKALTAVIVQHEGASWFFKISGATDAVSGATAGYDAFLASVKFPAGK